MKELTNQSRQRVLAITHTFDQLGIDSITGVDSTRLADVAYNTTETLTAVGNYATTFARIQEETQQNETDGIYKPAHFGNALLFYSALRAEITLGNIVDTPTISHSQASQVTPDRRENVARVRSVLDDGKNFAQEILASSTLLGTQKSMIPLKEIASFFNPNLRSGKNKRLSQEAIQTINTMVGNVEAANDEQIRQIFATLVMCEDTPFPHYFDQETIAHISQAGTVVRTFAQQYMKFWVAKAYGIDIPDEGSLREDLLPPANQTMAYLLYTVLRYEKLITPDISDEVIEQLFGSANPFLPSLQQLYRDSHRPDVGVSDIRELVTNQGQRTRRKPSSAITTKGVTSRSEPTPAEKAAEQEALKEKIKQQRLEEHARRLAEKAGQNIPKEEIAPTVASLQIPIAFSPVRSNFPGFSDEDIASLFSQIGQVTSETAEDLATNIGIFDTQNFGAHLEFVLEGDGVRQIRVTAAWKKS